MSYCTAKRMELLRRVQNLEEALRELLLAGASQDALKTMMRQLQDAQAEMALHGDCGD